MNIRRKITTILSAMILGVGAVAVAASPASAALSGPYRIKVPGINMCLDVRDVSYDNGATLQVYECLPYQYNQQFYINLAAGSGYWYEIRAGHSGKCVDVRDVSTASWAQIQQWDCLGYWQRNQHFQFWDSGNYTRIKAQHSGKCVDVIGDIYNGANVVQYPCGGAWQIVPW